LSRLLASFVRKVSRLEVQKLIREAIKYLIIVFQKTPFHIFIRNSFLLHLSTRYSIRMPGNVIKLTRPIPPTLKMIFVEETLSETDAKTDYVISFKALRFTIYSTASKNIRVLAGTWN
jgi:hypothetical protein